MQTIVAPCGIRRKQFYLDRQDARAQEILMCVEQGRTLADEKRLHHETDAYYLKSPSEMAMHFRDVPQALESAARIGT